MAITIYTVVNISTIDINPKLALLLFTTAVAVWGSGTASGPSGGFFVWGARRQKISLVNKMAFPLFSKNQIDGLTWVMFNVQLRLLNPHISRLLEIFTIHVALSWYNANNLGAFASNIYMNQLEFAHSIWVFPLRLLLSFQLISLYSSLSHLITLCHNTKMNQWAAFVLICAV
jgi:hypothetical protein